jgi:predicted RNA binding protein YcfA (HicA-like mRNA interferase family)
MPCALGRGGFGVHHVKDGHRSLRHPGKPELRVVVPVRQRDPAPGTLRSIIKRCRLADEGFVAPLRTA